MNFLVLATGFVSQYRTLRCAAEIPDSNVYVAGPERARSLAISRFCKGFFDIPSSDLTFDPAAAARIQALAQSLQIDLVLPSDSITTRFLSAIRKYLQVPVFPIPDLETFDFLDTKDRFANLCKNIDAPHPITYTFDTKQDLVGALESGLVKLPCIVKPVNMSGGIGILKIESYKLKQILNFVTYDPIVLQDFIKGEDICISMYCIKGEVIFHIVYNHSNGKFKFINNIILLEITQRIAAYLSYDGILNFDARLSADGSIYIIECNPRFWYNMDVALAAGANFVAFGVPETIYLRTAPPSAMAVEVHVPRASVLGMLRGRRPSDADMKLIRFWLDDPVVMMLAVLKYQKAWSSGFVERALSYWNYRGLADRRIKRKVPL